MNTVHVMDTVCGMFATHDSIPDTVLFLSWIRLLFTWIIQYQSTTAISPKNLRHLLVTKQTHIIYTSVCHLMSVPNGRALCVLP